MLQAVALDHTIARARTPKRPKYWDYLWTQERAEFLLIESQLACMKRSEGMYLRKKKRMLVNRAWQRIFRRK